MQGKPIPRPIRSSPEIRTFGIRSSPDHFQRPSGSQSGWEKRRNESFQVPAEEPQVTDSHQTISKQLSECWLVIGHRKCFVLLCPIGEQHLLSSYSRLPDQIIPRYSCSPDQIIQIFVTPGSDHPQIFASPGSDHPNIRYPQIKSSPDIRVPRIRSSRNSSPPGSDHPDIRYPQIKSSPDICAPRSRSPRYSQPLTRSSSVIWNPPVH